MQLVEQVVDRVQDLGWCQVRRRRLGALQRDADDALEGDGVLDGVPAFIFELLLDEDMTIDAGDETQEMVFHITHSGMAPVTRVIELYRPKITAGNTLAVASDGDISGNVDGSVASVASGGITAASIATGAIDADSLATDAVEEIRDGVWDAVLNAANYNIANSAGRRLRQVDASFVIHTGTAQAGASGSITLAAGASSTNDIYKNDGIIIVGGTGVGESAVITAYNGTTKVASVSPSFVVTPDNTSEYEIIPAITSTQLIGSDVITAAATATDFGTEVGTAVWASAARTLTALDEDNTTLDLDATIRSAVGLASANLDTQIGDVPTVAEFEARTPTAAQLAYIIGNSNTGYPVTFTTTGGTTTNAVLNQVDGATASATNDQYKGRLLVFTDGDLKGAVANITGYDGTTKYATITTVPTAPTSSHNARLL